MQMSALPTEALRRWVSGRKNHYESVSGAGAPACRQAGIAKNVTNK